jgi:hypothetical protein
MNQILVVDREECDRKTNVLFMLPWLGFDDKCLFFSKGTSRRAEAPTD